MKSAPIDWPNLYPPASSIKALLHVSALSVRNRSLAGAVLLLLIAMSGGSFAAGEEQYPGWGSYEPPVRKHRLGINLSPVRRWSSQQAFINVMKSSDPLAPACSKKDACGEGTGVGYEADVNGYPTAVIPDASEGKGWDRVRATPLLHDKGSYRRERFVVLYEGEGELSYGAGIRQLERKPGREVIHYENPNGGFLDIVKTNPDNPIRNIQVVAEEFENDFRNQPFDPQFLKVLAPFSVIRFMDWMQTNDEPAFDWRDRPKPESNSWMKSGVPVEIMVRLANTLQVDAWFTLPHNATLEYQQGFAAYVRQHLHPELSVYFELSNEVWNTVFPQTKWAQQLGEFGQPGSTAFSISQNYGHEAAKMCRNLKPMFGERDPAMKCVVATHTGWPERATWLLDCPGHQQHIGEPCYQWGDFDVLAVTTYFGNIIAKNENADMDGFRHVQAWRKQGDSVARDSMFNYLKTGDGWYGDDRHDIPATFKKIDTLTRYAEQRGLEIMAYEGGTHLVAAGNVHAEEDMVEWIKSVNRDERMGELYDLMMAQWDRSETRTLMCHYSSIAFHEKWGSFGLLENMWDDPSPRYQSLIDYIDGAR